MTHKLGVLVSSRALPNLNRIEYGHPCMLSSIQLLNEGHCLDRLKKLERLCATGRIDFVSTARDAREDKVEYGS
jgi:hypothetical protein